MNARVWWRSSLRLTTDQMKRPLLTASGAVVIAVVCAGVALGASGSAQPSRIAIHEQNKEVGNEHLGQFRLVLNDVSVDSGKTSIALIGYAAGQAKTVGGEPQQPVAGNDNLTGKKGTLSLAFRGIIILVNLNPSTGNAFSVAFGTWKVAAGTGIYKGWKGGGRWANSSNPTIENIEWDGDITR
jgi:hypothetical protein